MESIFTKAHVRVISPFEFDKLLNQIPKLEHKTLFNVCFWTGMRYVEIQRFHRFPEWWQKERKNIFLPEMAQKKQKRKQKTRYIPIANQLENQLGYFFEAKKPPHINVWSRNLKRWANLSGIDSEGISAKTTRASIESWMVTAKIPINEICLRQGHDLITSMEHYQAIPFTDMEKAEIKRRLSGWII